MSLLARTLRLCRRLVETFLQVRIISRRELERLILRSAVSDAERRELTLHRQLSSGYLTTFGTLANRVAHRSSAGVAGEGQSAERERRTAVVVITSISQLPHFKALCLGAEQRFRFVGFSVGELAKSDTEKFCREHDVPLLQHDFSLHDGRAAYQRYEESDDSVGQFEIDPLGADNQDSFSSEERSKIQAIDALLSEVRYRSISARRFQRVLNMFSADLVVLFEDNAEIDTGAWISVARGQMVPSVIIPFTIVDQLEPAGAHCEDPKYWADEGLYNRLAKLRYPHWGYRHEQRWLIRRAGQAVLAAEALGYAQPDPWVLNSSKANVIAVDSAAALNHYRRLGIPASQLELTGGLLDDTLYRSRASRNEICESLGLASDRPILLCSLPPNQLTAKRPQCEFRAYSELMAFWARSLDELTGWQIIVKTHPATNSDDLEYIGSLGWRTTTLDTATLIPICDLYVACVSATIRWALACGKPILNFDVFRYQYRDYIAASGVLTASSCAEFTTLLRRLCGEKSAEFVQLTANAEREASHWGKLDGSNLARILDLFDRLTAGHSRPGREAVGL